MKKTTVEKIIFVFLLAIVLTYTLACMNLHYMQALNPEPVTYFESDLPAHIEMALDGWGYSLTAILYRILSIIPSNNVFCATVAGILALTECATVALTYYYLKKHGMNGVLSLSLAIASSIVMPAFVRAIQPTRYIGYQSPSIWHNSTYIFMKLFALATLMLYFKMCRQYRDKIVWKDLIVFAILLMVTTAVKTNFVLCFAPMALCMLILDCIMSRKVKNAVIVALSIIPTIFVILFQEMVLFGEEMESGLVFDLFYTAYIRCERPYFTMILSAAFPVFIFLFNIVPVLKETYYDFKKKRKDITKREFLSGWMMWFFAIIPYLTIRETGYRSEAANFVWGYDFALFYLFIVSIREFVAGIINKKFLGKKKIIRYAYIGIGSILLTYHTYCGIVFFVRLLMGITYFA